MAAVLGACSCASAQEQALREAARLDAEGKCEQAEPYYRQALARGTPSPSLLNNAGNHYLVCGQAGRAREYFETLLKVNPAHQNANLQLARIATESKQGALALRYLDKVTDRGPAVLILRAEALHAAGRAVAAAGLLDTLRKEAHNDPRVLFTLGLAAARMGLFEKAEAAFSAAAAQAPGNFEVLFNLGKAASRAGHYDRAAGTLEAARKLRPADSSVLLELGRAHAGERDDSRAVYVLAQARSLAPANPEILLALAQAAERAGFFGDSALAYDEYLALRPSDDSSRLDRARVYALTGARLAEGLKELEWYVRGHPKDPNGFFTLARFTWSTDAEAALTQLAQALRLDPGFVPAHFGRAWLLQRLGRMEESLPHLEATVRLAPNNARAVDQLGLAYLSLERPAEAEKTLRKAASLDPGDREILMHLSQALMALDREEEARQCLEKFKTLPARQVRDPRTEAGMIELATMPSAESARREIERLRKQAAEHPSQPELQLKLAQLLLSQGPWEQAEAAFDELATRNAGGDIWREAGAALLRAQRYEPAIEFLKRGEAHLELALALSFTAGPEAALKALERTPPTGRGGDYLLLRARLLDAAGNREEAEQALQQGLRLAVSRPEVARQAALALLGRQRGGEALALLDQALRSAPAHADLFLLRAVVLGLLGRKSEAERALREVQFRWPEWDRPYLAYGLLLEAAGRITEARGKMQTALALNPGSRCRPSELRQLLEPECEGVR